MHALSKETWTRLACTGLLLLVFSFYFLFNRHLTPRFEFQTYADNLIPFSAPFGVLYVSYLGLLWGSVMYGFTRLPLDTYKKFVASLIVVQGVAYFFYVMLPGYIARPALHENDFFIDLVRTIYAVDMPSSLTPSLHVSNSWLIALTLTKRVVIRGALIFWAILIILSTLLIKQHYLVDVFSGILLSTITYAGFEHYWNRPTSVEGRIQT